jgi:hypothetical protein
VRLPWRERAEKEAGSDDVPIKPEWGKAGVPWCKKPCPYMRTPRCEVLAYSLPAICVPVVIEMARMLDAVFDLKDEKENPIDGLR